jgi:KDO2-lipid IV(A) lauroyltransferase
VRKKPANYLWSHRRWKWEFDPEKHGDLIVK